MNLTYGIGMFCPLDWQIVDINRSESIIVASHLTTRALLNLLVKVSLFLDFADNFEEVLIHSELFCCHFIAASTCDGILFEALLLGLAFSDQTLSMLFDLFIFLASQLLLFLISCDCILELATIEFGFLS